jgi:hypothetical protein
MPKSKTNKKIKKSKNDKYTIKNFNSKLRCSPERKEKDYTCYSDDSLLKLRNYWNARHPDKRINGVDPREIWNELRNNMINTCNIESCWLRQKFVKEKIDKELLEFTFAPKSPESWKQNSHEWLSSTDIEKVMKQYEHTYPSFSFIGPSPIDFDSLKIYGQCVWEELCNFNLYNYLNDGKTKIGIIFNTDPHYKSGSHWIALFINVQKKYIYYFDSNGNEIPNEIKKLTDRIKLQGNTLGIEFKLMSNYKFEHQRTQSECGMYVLYFIIQLITNQKDITSFGKVRIPDEEVYKLRHEYFNDTL